MTAASRMCSAGLLLALGVAAMFGQRPAQPASVDGADEADYLKAALPLDEPRHFCVDVAGHGAAANPDQPLGVHTCKDGMWNLDQRFRRVGADLFLMPQYDRCLAAAEASPGADVVLAECESSELTSWEYSGSRLRLESRPELCLTIGEEPAELTPGGQRAPTRYVARSLGLEPCAREATARQLFTISPPLDIPERLTPEMAR